MTDSVQIEKMSLKNVTKTETNQATVELLIPKKDFDEAVAKVFKKEAPKISIPGFRKGKAPRSIIEKMYGKGVFYEDALNNILPKYVEEAVKESGIEVVSQPEVEIGDINDEGVTVSCKYFTKPEITVKDYKGIKATKTVRKVEKAEIDAEIERARQRTARTVEVTDRAAQLEDTAVIDYEGSIDGVKFEGGADKGHHLKLGSGQFIPGFEEQIVGHNAGDEFDVNVTFPEDYHAEDLKGKKAVFKVKLNSIEVTELPAVDDDFAKDVSEFDTLSEYKKDIKAKIEDRNEKTSENEIEGQLVDALIAQSEGDVPECMFNDECENMLRDYEYNMQSQGISMEMYLKYTGMTLEDMKKQFMPQAERAVRSRLALEAIAKAENFEISDKDFEDEYERIAKAYNMETDKVKEMISKELLAKDLAAHKAIDFVKANAVITEKAPEENKPAAKKAPAKKAADKKPADKSEAAEKKPAAKKTAAKKTDAKKAEKADK